MGKKFRLTIGARHRINILVYNPNEFMKSIHIHGRVQGVGFRWNAAYQAKIRGITGFVKNMPDGSVYIEAEGEREILEDFIAWCRLGPPLSSVESVEVNSFPPAGYKEFRIVH